MNDNVILFTHSFPFGKGEQFLESEIVYLAKKFKKVYIFSNEVDENKRPLPANCIVLSGTVNFNTSKKLRYYFLSNFFRILRYYIYLVTTSKYRKYYLKNIGSILINLTVLVKETDLFYDALENPLKETGVLYFYWCINPLIHFSFLKAEKKINHKLIVRAHSFDFDPATNKLGFFLFREIELKYLDHLLLDSKWGSKLESTLYPEFAPKISTSYLGVENKKEANPDNETPVFHLVSCSFIEQRKRIHLIVEILRHINIPLKWTHIGDPSPPPLYKEMEQNIASLRKNIEFEYLGLSSNSLVHNYYKTVPCDLFITTTLIEGLPVSLMESIAHGIPIMGTAVCGIPEIVNEQTGFLIPENFNPEDVAKIIENYSLKSKEEKNTLRRNAYTFYEENFNAEKRTIISSLKNIYFKDK